MCAPATPHILDEFHSNSQLESTVLVSSWELGEVIGPLIIGPVSELYGRLPVYHTANIILHYLLRYCSRKSKYQHAHSVPFSPGTYSCLHDPQPLHRRRFVRTKPTGPRYSSHGNDTIHRACTWAYRGRSYIRGQRMALDILANSDHHGGL